MRKLLSLLVAAAFATASVTAMAQDKKDMPKKEPTAAQKKQQERMKQCNAQAAEKNLKGDERKKFMSGCLKPAAKKSDKPKMEKKTEKKS
jgi:Ni/Co efflux regulator RcnB